MSDTNEYQRQAWWMQVYQHYLQNGDMPNDAKKGADLALAAFDEQFKPKSTEELKAIFAKGHP